MERKECIEKGRRDDDAADDGVEREYEDSNEDGEEDEEEKEAMNNQDCRCQYQASIR